jgi:hypothetical protein
MNQLLPIAVCALISLFSFACLLKFGLKNGKPDWKYSWLVLGIVLPWFYFLTDSIHLSLPGGPSLDLHFRQSAKKTDAVAHAGVDPDRAYSSLSRK